MSSKDNSGALFKEEEKKTDKHPDYRGICLVNGVEYSIACWITTSKAGKPYMSLSFTTKEEQAKYSKKTTDATSEPVFAETTSTDDELPF